MGDANDELPGELRAWVEATAATRVRRAHRHLAGASRQAWSIDSDAGGLFLMRDNLGGSGGSARDATVLRALRDTPIPVPHVYGNDAALGTLLLERVEGHSDFPAIDDDAERESTAQHLMQLTAALHALDPAGLDIDHLGPPAAAVDPATAQLAHAQGAAKLLGERAAPLFLFALAWLARNTPPPPPQVSLVHSDMGPGNFIFAGGRVRAILDWEVAHWGDPMEDLAAVSIRDMATPIGDLPTRFAEYRAASAHDVRLDALRWYRVFVLTRNSMLITVGLQAKNDGLDRGQLEMYRLNLMRAASLALCDAIGVERPVESPLDPAGDDPYAYAPIEQELDLAEMNPLLAEPTTDVFEAWKRIAALFDDPRRDAKLAEFFARHLLRRAMVGAAILGRA